MDKLLHFSGLEWKVKSSGNPRGPGPNFWSSDNVWVEDDGLHLQVKQTGDKWTCGAIQTTQTVGYGEYRFYLVGRPDRLDPNIVLGLFVYENDNKEIDIEFSRWGNTSKENGWYVIQPLKDSQDGFKRSFDCRLQGTHSTHSFEWEKNRIAFKSLHGHYIDAHESHIINQAECLKNIPKPDKFHLHMNLWLFQGKSPQKTAEIVIERVEYVPELMKGLNYVTHNQGQEMARQGKIAIRESRIPPNPKEIVAIYKRGDKTEVREAMNKIHGYITMGDPPEDVKEMYWDLWKAGKKIRDS